MNKCKDKNDNSDEKFSVISSFIWFNLKLMFCNPACHHYILEPIC